MINVRWLWHFLSHSTLFQKLNSKPALTDSILLMPRNHECVPNCIVSKFRNASYLYEIIGMLYSNLDFLRLWCILRLCLLATHMRSACESGGNVVDTRNVLNIVLYDLIVIDCDRNLYKHGYHRVATVSRKIF